MTRLFLATISALLAMTAMAAPAPAIEPGIAQSSNWAPDEAPLARSMGAKWVRIFAIYSQGCPLPPHEASRLDAYQANGVKVLVVGTGSSRGNTTPPSDPREYARWMTCLARTYGERIDAFEIWNEPDERSFWSTGPDPAAYTALLKHAYTSLKQVRPNAPVLVGGLTGNNFHFVEKLYANGAKGSFDAVGVHTDTACLIRDPGFYYREPDGRIGRFAFTGFREVRHVMARHGDAKPIWMTEIGWSTLTSKCTHPGVKEDRPSGVTPAQQAHFLRRAYACAAAEPYIGPVFWFSHRDAGRALQYDHHLGLMDYLGRPKPAFHAFKELFAGGSRVKPDAACGAKLDKDVPAVTADVPSRYVSRLRIRGRASDRTTPIQRIELWVDGARVAGTNRPGPDYDLDWFGSTKLSQGRHTVELRAYDEAQNVGRAKVDVVRLDASRAPRTEKAGLAFSTERAARGRIRVAARVTPALSGEFPEDPRGRLRILFDRRDGGRWKRTSSYTKGISKPIRFTYAPKRPGTWRVRARLLLDAPYKRTRVAPRRFRVR